MKIHSVGQNRNKASVSVGPPKETEVILTLPPNHSSINGSDPSLNRIPEFSVGDETEVRPLFNFNARPLELTTPSNSSSGNSKDPRTLNNKIINNLSKH